jgi:hypothetical protein
VKKIIVLAIFAGTPALVAFATAVALGAPLLLAGGLGAGMFGLGLDMCLRGSDSSSIGAKESNK